MKRLLREYLRPYYGRMAVGFFIKFIGSIMDLFLPWILAYMIDTIIPLKDQGLIYLWGAMMIVCSLLAVSFNIIANRMAGKVARDTTRMLRHDLFEKVIYLSNEKIDDYTKPSLMSRLTSDTYNVHQMVGRMQRLGIRAPILLIGGIIITLTLDAALSGVLILMMPFLVFIMTKVSKKSIPLYQKLQRSIDQFVRIMREDISGIRVIKALSKESYEQERFKAINEEVVAHEKQAGIMMAKIEPVVQMIMNLALVGVIVVGAFRVNSGISEVGKILAFMTYFTIILNAMMSISKMFVVLSKAIASANRIEEILEVEDERELEKILVHQIEKEKQSSVLEDDTIEEEPNHIEFKQVYFAYNAIEQEDTDISLEIGSEIKEDEAIHHLSDISFKLKRGETLGILGGTGSGKTTIVNLLLRLYDIKEGRILIDGQPIESLPVKALRSRFGVALQNDTIFEDTIFENVRLGRNLNEAQIEEALLYARAKEFVDEKEGKLTQALSIKGANLSGGQKQRVLIARALATKPEILILDDASSALDYKTDAMLRQALKEHFKETTKIIIAQRVSSVMQADQIIVLEDGKMIGYGNHEELLINCQAYKEMSASQMGGHKN